MAPITKARRGYKFTVTEMEHLLETVEDVIPIGNPDWERIWQEHSARYPTKERTAESLKRKFQELARKKIPTGDPNCPPYIRDAKRIFRKIVQATDGSTGGGSDDEVETWTDREDEAEDEDDAEDINDGNVFGSNDDDDDIGIILPNPAALLPRLGDGGNNSFSANEPTRVGGRSDAESARVGDCSDSASARGVSRSDTASARGGSRSDTASARGGSNSDTASARGGRKRKAGSDEPSKEGAGGGQKSRALTQPFKTPRKSRDNDDEGNGLSFQNMMSMMMYQSRVESEHRERQSKVEAEQRDREYQLRRDEMAQGRAELEQRERQSKVEAELRREEMAIAREDARAQRQVMNMMMMAMINRNAEGGSTQPQPPPRSPMDD
jgi:hypothetical protein